MSELRVLRIGAVEERTSFSRTTVWRLEREGRFPKRRRFGPGVTGWLSSEIDAWLESRPVVDVGTEEKAA